MARFLLLLLVAVVLGIVGFVVKGIFYLFIIGLIVFLASFVVYGLRLSRARQRPSR